MRHNRVIFQFIILCFLFSTGYMPAGGQNKLILHPELAKDTISKEIYGHFAEHLGRCIYDGI